MLRKFGTPLIAFCLSVILQTGVAPAAEMYTVAGGETVTINEHGICRRVKNNESTSRMVPTKTSGEWNSVISNPSGLVLSACSCSFSTWTAIGPTGKYFRLLGVSKDGNVLAAIDTVPTLSIDDNETGQIYISTNGGSTWTARGGATMLVSDFDMSDDGTVMAFAGTDNGYPNGYNNYFVSTNSGTSWTKRTNADPGLGVAVSADGSTIAIAEYSYWGSGNIKTSTNGGSSWTVRRASDAYYDVAMGATGSIMAAGTNGTGGRMYTTTNTGSTWTARGPTMGWVGIVMSDDGNVIAGLGQDQSNYENSGLYVSTNGGSTFTKAISSPLAFYAQKPSMSADGSVIVSTNTMYSADFTTVTYDIRFSTNSGGSWTARHPINDTSRGIGSALVSGDGQTLYATVTGTVPSGQYLPGPGRVYKSTCN